MRNSKSNPIPAQGSPTNCPKQKENLLDDGRYKKELAFWEAHERKISSNILSQSHTRYPNTFTWDKIASELEKSQEALRNELETHRKDLQQLQVRISASFSLFHMYNTRIFRKYAQEYL